MATLTVGTGMRLEEVRNRSSLRLDLQGMRDDSPLVIEQPVALHYAIAKGTIALGPTLTVWVNQLGGVVVDVALAPQSQALPMAAALELADELRKRLSQAGFQATEAAALTGQALGSLQAQIDQLPVDRPFARRLGQWELDGQRVTMTLKRLVDPPTGLNAPGGAALFLVDLYFSDDALDASQRRLLLKSRQDAGLPPGEKLPLSRWVRGVPP